MAVVKDGVLEVRLPPKLVPLFEAPRKRFRIARGGRGSGKTRNFAEMAAIRALMFAKEGRRGIILCGRELQKSLDESSFAEVKAAILGNAWLASEYDVGDSYIRTKDRRVSFVFTGLRHNLDSIKSMGLILLCWIDEAERVSEVAWVKLIPTVREAGSEIWVTYNQERKTSATNKRFGREARLDDDMAAVDINFCDNPFFPDVLEAERQRDLRDRPEEYPHIWMGDYATATKGAYYSRHLLTARQEGRICRVAFDPMMSVLTFHDLAGSSDKADAYAMWIVQFVDREVRALRYYEAIGQSPHYHTNFLKEWCIKRNVKRAHVTLPHDGDQVQIDHHWKGYWDKASTDEVTFEVRVIPNQGKGAADKRIRSLQELFPRILFNNSPDGDVEDATEAGREALGNYHERWDDERQIGLGPNHNWASHGSDAAGLMAMKYEPPRKTIQHAPAPEYGTMA